jgi:hypothetical protein
VSSELSERGLARRERIRRERDRHRRRLAQVGSIGGSLMMISTLFAWENHPRVVPSVTHPKTLVVHEVRHSIGLATLPAGPVVLLIGLAALFVASRLPRGSVRTGWETLVAGLAGLGMSLGEFTQLLLGRRNYLHGFPGLRSPLVNAVGAGVWLATLASLAVSVSALTYLWVAHATWRH